MATEIQRRLAGIPVGKTTIEEGEKTRELLPTASILFPTGVSVKDLLDGTEVRVTSYKPSFIPFSVSIEAHEPIVLREGEQATVRRILGLVAVTISRR